MKTKFMGIIGGITMAALLFIAPVTAKAQNGPFLADVTIHSVTQDGTSLDVRASNVVQTGFQNVRFSILNTSEAQKSQLAILLTAMSTGKNVRITFTTQNPAPSPNPNIITKVELVN